MLLVAVPAAYAQRATAGLRGTVSDATGAVVPGATVTVKNDATGVARSATTNEAGRYSFPDLPVATYRVEVTFAGFRPATVNNVALSVAEEREVDVRLETGPLQEAVVVEASGTPVQTVGGDVAGVVTGAEARELPLNGGNFMQLTLLMPGVSAPDQNLKLTDKGLLGGSDLSVSGSGTTANLWLVDGANNNDIGSNRTILIYPNVESIEEFKIHRSSYSAEFGQASGATVNVVTKSGTNDFHGSLYYFGRNEKLNSRSYFLEKADQPKENLSRHDFGFSLGGPILKDRLHFFASQGWNREKRGTVRNFQVPTMAERRGDFSVRTACSGPVPVDPLTGQPFPGNVIPQNRLSPAGLLMAQVWPEPNVTPGAGTCNNWVTSLDTPINWRQENLRVDFAVSDSTRLMVRYTQDSWENGAPNLYSSYWGDDPFPAIDSTWDQPGRSLVLQLSNNIGSRAVNTLTFSYSGNQISTIRG
ncbi:MAG TPA: TonB-dependent receptor, partial [Vicinamibacteria bacterium]|nr:TonB-dependent receptor [Vicinamibacteria bacterium]